MRVPRLALAVLAVCTASAALAAEFQPPTLESLIGAAGSYMAAYEDRASAVVFDEIFEQRVSRWPGSFDERRLRSEVAVLNTGDLGWVGCRDVIEVDGQPVQDRQARLQKLFAAPLTAAGIARARRVTEESARFNLGSVRRDLNYPTMALIFLRQAHQRRSTFSREGAARVGGVATWIVAFEEVARPTLIATRAGDARLDVVTSGRFWIEPDSGWVRRTQITVELAHATGHYDVVYGSVDGLDVLMPLSMEESFTTRASGQPFAQTVGDIRPIEVVRGVARYTNFKRFTVDVTAGAMPPAAPDHD